MDDYSASVVWGDPNVSAGMISYDQSSGIFSVYGNLTFDEAGTQPITVTIGRGDSPTATVTGSATVARARSSISLAAPVSIVYGQSASFTATVSGFGTPTGTVTFYTIQVDPADQLGTVTLSTATGHDQATLSVPGLAASASPYTIIAVYNDDANNQGSTSGSVSQVVSPALLNITAGSLTKMYGQAVTLVGTSIHRDRPREQRFHHERHPDKYGRRRDRHRRWRTL